MGNKHIKKHLREIRLNLGYLTQNKTLRGKVRYYLFSIKWLWKNRNWQNNSKKFKALDKAYWEQIVAKCCR